MTAALISVALLWVSTTRPALGETTVGRWCDRMIPNMPKHNYILAIVIDDEGKVVLKRQFRNGSSSTRELREVAGNIYEMPGVRYGDKFRIVPSTGYLQLLDNDGLIRIASRLENTPQRGECFH